jgi:hypothetical protein
MAEKKKSAIRSPKPAPKSPKAKQPQKGRPRATVGTTDTQNIISCSGSLSLCVNNSRTVSLLCNVSESRECWCWEAVRPLYCPCNAVAYRQ